MIWTLRPEQIMDHVVFPCDAKREGQMPVLMNGCIAYKVHSNQ